MVGARVSSKRKKRWDDFIEESSEFNTQAQLVRTSVERLIKDTQSDDSEQLNAIQDDLQGLMTEIRQTRLDIDNLEDSIDGAEEISDELMFELQQILSDSDDQ